MHTGTIARDPEYNLNASKLRGVQKQDFSDLLEGAQKIGTIGRYRRIEAFCRSKQGVIR